MKDPFARVNKFKNIGIVVSSAKNQFNKST